MYLQQFDYEAVHIPGKTNAADYLSRHSLAATSSDEKASEKREEVTLSLVSSCVPMAVTLEEIQRETALDAKMQCLIPLIVTGNQNTVKADSELAPYGQIFPELSVAHAVVHWGHQICIPESLQDRIIDICHEAHMELWSQNNYYRLRFGFQASTRRWRESSLDVYHARLPQRIITMASYKWIPCQTIPGRKSL